MPTEKITESGSQYQIKLHLIYWILPLLIIGLLMFMYFSGIPWMVEFVCPQVNREYGFLENFQLVILLVTIIVCFRASIKKKYLLEKFIFLIAAAITIFLFLEESDYGSHYLVYFTGEGNTIASDLIGHTNFHTQGNTWRVFKYTSYILIGSFFFLFPLLKNWFEFPVIHHIIPRKLIVTTALLALLSNLIPKFFMATGLFERGPFGNNLGEFSEAMVYYIFSLYLYEFAFEKDFILSARKP